MAGWQTTLPRLIKDRDRLVRVLAEYDAAKPGHLSASESTRLLDLIQCRIEHLSDSIRRLEDVKRKETG